jgi:hypothetical protein
MRHPNDRQRSVAGRQCRLCIRDISRMTTVCESWLMIDRSIAIESAAVDGQQQSYRSMSIGKGVVPHTVKRCSYVSISMPPTLRHRIPFGNASFPKFYRGNSV